MKRNFGIGFELAHLIEFGILYFLLILSFLTFSQGISRKKEVIALGIAMLFSLTDEIHQLFVPFRSFSPFDLVKDVLGIFIVWYLFRRSYFRKRPSETRLFFTK